MKLKFEFKRILNNKDRKGLNKYRICENREFFPGIIEFTIARTKRDLNTIGGWTFYKPKKL